MTSNRGFTLIELLIVVMLIGVLAALTAPFLMAAKAAANQASAIGSLRALNTGPDAVNDLETALTDILACFRQGDNNVLTRLVARAYPDHPPYAGRYGAPEEV